MTCREDVSHPNKKSYLTNVLFTKLCALCIVADEF